MTSPAPTKRHMAPLAVFTLAELSNRWRVSKRTLIREINSRQLKAIRIGNTYRVLEQSVLAYEHRRATA